MWRDLRNAVRALAHTPSFTIAAVLALALAIGANGAIFGLVDALWLRPPGVRDAGTLVRVFATTPAQDDGAWSWPEYQDIAARVGAFEQVAVRGRRGAVLTADDGSQELLLVNVVSTNFFDLLGVQAALGRTFHAGDDGSLQSDPGVVLGHSFWQTYFGADPAVVGRTIQLGPRQAHRVRVLGILPRTFRELEAAVDRDVWLPPQVWQNLTGDRREFDDRGNRWFELVARRRPAASVAAAGDEMSALAASFAREYPALAENRGARVLSDLDYRLEGAGVAARAMLGLVLLVVIITCVNIANLLLARAAARRQELAVRAALGAGRWRIVRQLMAESLALAVLGAAGGLIVASWLIRLLPALMTTPPGMRSFVVFQTDARVLLFTAAVTLLTTLFFGLAPAFVGARADAMRVIRTTTGARRQDGGWRRVLVAGQVAVSLTMLCMAVVLARSYVETQRGDIGFERKPLLTVWTMFESRNSTTGAEAVRQLRALPGVTDVAVAVRAPFSLSGGGLSRPVEIPGLQLRAGEALPRVKFNAVSANYFDVFGTRLVRGRGFPADDTRGGDAAVVVTEQFVRQFFGDNGDPIGARVLIAGTPHRVVGVAQDGDVNEIGEEPQPYMYLPFWRGDYSETTFVLEAATGDPAALAAGARRVLRQISAALEPRRMVTQAQYLEFATSLHRTTAALAVILAVTGLVLTTIGVYGVVAYRMTTRTKEIGIRMALGAMDTQVMRMVLRDGLTLAAAGILVGIPVSLAAMTLSASMLVGVKPWDPAAVGAAAIVLLAAVTCATLVPARRAAHIDPALALQS